MKDFDKELYSFVGWEKVHTLALIFMSNIWELLGVCCMAKEDSLSLTNLPLLGKERILNIKRHMYQE